MKKPQPILVIWKNSFLTYPKSIVKLLPFTLLIVFLQIALRIGVGLINCYANPCLVAAKITENILLYLINVWVLGSYHCKLMH